MRPYSTDSRDTYFVSAACRGAMSEHDLAALLERHHADAFGWALSCCAWDRGEAEDVLQTSYLKVLDGRARFEGRSSFKTWLFGVVRRTAAEVRRRRAIWRWVGLSRLADQPHGDASPSDALGGLARSDAAETIRRALAALPTRQREVLHLVFYQELTIREAADVLRVSLGTARRHYERGKAALRQRLEPELRRP